MKATGFVYWKIPIHLWGWYGSRDQEDCVHVTAKTLEGVVEKLRQEARFRARCWGTDEKEAYFCPLVIIEKRRTRIGVNVNTGKTINLTKYGGLQPAGHTGTWGIPDGYIKLIQG